ncbi:MAG TPA: ankyrin repeat domain-containing protein [Bryobacteraceae bacterium]|nr:ankyrin repeat domain-containing protein [Bryobacteraceae bacterium]
MRIEQLTKWSMAALLSVACYAATNGITALVDAAKNQDQESVRALLKQHVDVNAAEPDGTTALHWAAHWNDLEMVDLLLKNGANVSALNRYGATPLSEAVRIGSGALIGKLLDAGADANTTVTAQGETVLMRASRFGNLEAVKVLLDHDADVNAKENFRGQTALMWAAAEGHADVVQALAAKGADLNVRSFDRDTTLPKMEAGTPLAPIARGGLTALLFAAREGQMDAARALLDAKADVNAVDSDGNNALVLAILNSHYDLAQFLIDRGADPNIAAKNGRTALYTAVEQHDVDWSPRPARKETDKTTSMDIIKSLVDHKANVNARLKAAAPIWKLAQDMGSRTLAEGATPFMLAARSADVDLMHYLLDHGADPKLANKDGLTALMVAAGIGWDDHIRGTEAEALAAVKLCSDLGLSVNGATDKGETALHGAAHRGSDSIVKFLAEKGGNLNARNKKGFTPLDLAMGKGGYAGGLGPVHETTASLIKTLGGTPGQEVKETAKAGE